MGHFSGDGQFRAPDKKRKFNFNRLYLRYFLTSSSNKWSNIGFGQEIGILEIKICTLSVALDGPSSAFHRLLCTAINYIAWCMSLTNMYVYLYYFHEYTYYCYQNA